jgi:hypothetical protein
MTETFTRPARSGRGQVTYIPTTALGPSFTHLKIDVYHSKGGANFWHGTTEPGGYWISLGAVKEEHGSFIETISLGGDGYGRRLHILSVPRFNAKKFAAVVAALTAIQPALTERALVADYWGVEALAKAAVA